ncbi:probable WRKY transcription factor 27 [Zingiber officinale]|uniref:WRKY domain-containing protein n=1 Tax=Zingiber officinale TaxID=94328 RepID=A0A8J5F1I2_ZINOF|nr:probable WRKY transcription factor 27 [Zingiber officinale]KAG6479887.1 hypothetical protein ZIOFF_063363 [Zingiber officinale]
MSTPLSLALSSLPALTKSQRPIPVAVPLLLLSTPATVGWRMFTVAAEMDGDNWDLGAVVRSCRPSGSSAARDAVWAFPPLPEPFQAVEGGQGGVFVSRSSRSAAGLGSNLLPLPREADRLSCQAPRSRRRKSRQQQQLKKVVRHVAADDLSSDICAWRKYGQKPIKGSPYPRGYYKCSSSKGCPARKQVERSQADSALLIITYTGDHNHSMPTNYNSLDGSTSYEFPRSPSDSNQEASPLYSAAAAPELSPTTPLSASILRRTKKREGSVDEAEVEEAKDNDEGELLVEDMEIISEDDLLFLAGVTSPTVADMTTTSDGDSIFPLL